MSTATQSVEVDAALGAVYEHWTELETFARFLGGVRRVRRVAEQQFEWLLERAGAPPIAHMLIVEDRPYERIAWTSSARSCLSARVGFESLAPMRTRVSLQVDYDPAAVATEDELAQRRMHARLRRDLRSFQRFVEGRLVR